MKILHICASWEQMNGAAVMANLIMNSQRREGHTVSSAIYADREELHNADEVWIHCGWKPCLWRAAFMGRNIKWMPHGCYDPVRLRYHGWKKRIAGPVERACLRRADRIIATCSAEKSWIEKYLGKKCPEIEVHDPKRFFNLDCADGVSACRSSCNGRSLHLLYLGRRHPLKGLEFLEKAVECLRRRNGDLETEIKSEGSQSAICNPPPELRIVSSAVGAEKEKAWDWCDVLVLPTLSENFGLVVAEALEKGKRVITTDGAPAWGVDARPVEGCAGLYSGYGGRLIYLKGFRCGSTEERVRLLAKAIETEMSGRDWCSEYGLVR